MIYRCKFTGSNLPSFIQHLDEITYLKEARPATCYKRKNPLQFFIIRRLLLEYKINITSIVFEYNFTRKHLKISEIKWQTFHREVEPMTGNWTF